MIIDKIYDILIDKYLFYAYVSDYKIIVTLDNFSISFIWHSLWFNWDNNYMNSISSLCTHSLTLLYDYY